MVHRRLWLLFILGLGLLAAAGHARLRSANPGLEPALAAELERLDAAAPAVVTLAARYKLTSTSTVDGAVSSYERQGRIFVDRGAVAIYRYLAGETAEMQLLYRDGELLRWFPFSAYAHRVVRESWDKDDTDFGMVWRPWLAHLYPGKELATVAALSLAPKAKAGEAPAPLLLSDPDQAAEVDARPKGAKLEYWGPRPDLAYHAGGETPRLERFEATHFRAGDGGAGAEESKRHVVTLGGALSVHGVTIPSKIELQAFLPGQNVPYRTISVELYDLKVNEGIPDDAFLPAWPADSLFLDVETQSPAAYLPTAERPESMILLADYHLGTDQIEEGKKWIERWREKIGDRPLTPPEVDNLARLLTRAGDRAAGLELHLRALKAAEERLAAEPGATAEQLAGRHYAAYAYFLARNTGQRLNPEAARFLEGKVKSFKTPLAIATLAGRIADHYTAADQYDKAREVLIQAQKTAGSDAAAAAWLESCLLRVAEAEARDEHLARVRGKTARIRELEKSLADLLAKRGDGPDTTKIEALRAELARLRSRP